MKKMKKMLFSIILSFILCIPTFAVNASQLSDYYGGTWWDLYSQRCYMEITSYNDALFVAISWGHSAFESSEWRMTAFYNPATGKFHYNDCKYSILSSDDYGNDVETIQYVNGSGTIYISSNGYLYWEDYVEQTGMNCYFEKDTMEYSQNTVVQLQPNDVVNVVYGSNYNAEIEMEIGTYSMGGGIYVNFFNSSGIIWTGNYPNYSYLENGGLRLIFYGTNCLTGANDYLTIDWSSPESTDFPSVNYTFDNIGISGSYSYDCMLMMP
jgi:hypothetical protein